MTWQWPPRKTRSNTIGKQTEEIAKQFLLAQKLVFVEQNFHSRHGEIDLIFRDESTWVFIEVRYRQQSHFGSAVETVHTAKQRKLTKAAGYYLYKNKLAERVNARFDVVGIEPMSRSGKMESDAITQPATQRYSIPGYHIHWVQHAFECA